MNTEIFVRGLAYALGEKRHEYPQASGWAETTAAARMPDMPELWGWGNFYTTEDPYGLGLESARRTLEIAGIDPLEIDLTIFACSYFPHADDALYQGTGRMMKSLGLTRSLVEGQTLGGCATLLSAVRSGAHLVRMGAHRNVLVVGIDVLPPGVTRFFDYALFTDAAASCVLSETSPTGCPKIVESARGVNLDEIVGGVRFNAKDSLHVRVLKGLLDRAGCSIGDIRKVFNNNVFLPIKTQKDTMAGFKRSQTFVENVRRVGHCFACDSFVNLADYAQSQRVAPGERFILQADGNGCCAAVLLAWEQT